MSASQFFTILRARWKLMALIFLVIVSAVVGVSLVLPRQYTANAAVMVDVKSPDPIAGVVFPGMMAPSYMATQVDIIASDRVAQSVVKALKLQDNAAMRDEWQASTGGAGSYAAWLAELLQRNLSVKPARESNVITVSFRAVDPKFAAAMANAFVQAYIDTTVELRVSPARQYAGFFDERASALRADLDSAQGRLSAYQKEHGVTAADERLDIETARLNDLSSQLVTLQAVAAESSSRKAQATASAETLQDVINNPVVANLKADLLRQQARLEEISARLGSAHPQVRELNANIAELQSKLNQEMRRVGSSVAVTNTINRSREAQVRSSLEAQRTKVLRLKEVRDGMSVLMRDVELAQRAYDQVRARATQSTLESQSTQTNVFLLSPAVEPVEPSSPRLLLNTVLGAAVALLIAAAAALLREMADSRVRSVQDLEDNIGVPLLGVLDPPGAGGMFQRRRSSQIRKRVLGGLRPVPRLN